jgi:hypothetical protein
MRMCHIGTCSLPGSTMFYLHYLINGKIFGGKKKFSFSLQLLFETFLILRRNERDVIINVYWSSCKTSAILVIFNES